MKYILSKMVEWLMPKIKCHPECDFDVPCHCGFCGQPNQKNHNCYRMVVLRKIQHG